MYLFFHCFTAHVHLEQVMLTVLCPLWITGNSHILSWTFLMTRQPESRDTGALMHVVVYNGPRENSTLRSIPSSCVSNCSREGLHGPSEHDISILKHSTTLISWCKFMSHDVVMSEMIVSKLQNEVCNAKSGSVATTRWLQLIFVFLGGSPIAGIHMNSGTRCMSRCHLDGSSFLHCDKIRLFI